MECEVNHEVSSPHGFLRLSEATAILARGMWARFNRPLALREFRKTEKRGSVGYGPWRDVAAEWLRQAAFTGQPEIYVIPDPELPYDKRPEGWPPPPTTEPILVPTRVLRRLVTSRSGLPDHAICPTLKTADGNRDLYVALRSGMLAVRESEFAAWYRSDRARRKWPSQRQTPPSKRASGRPTQQTPGLKSAVLALVHDEVWSAKDGIAKLRRILLEGGRSDIPSPDTLQRLVAQLSVETGNSALFRRPRVRRRRLERPLPQNPL